MKILDTYELRLKDLTGNYINQACKNLSQTKINDLKLGDMEYYRDQKKQNISTVSCFQEVVQNELSVEVSELVFWSDQEKKIEYLTKYIELNNG